MALIDMNERLELSSSDQWASKCAQCFGNRCNEVKDQNKEPSLILVMGGRFWQR
ncbi:hypothetical protein VP01_956g6 [Puccinia sorghi]|uniref:Uncharacterized protein n=1 Tax=Puccinia sorghi TaxID=27349 RepID=A0A0L6U691_9BASI|nr:hypothetical protein VP01_956g6 [Puccinia sorghi]